MNGKFANWPSGKFIDTCISNRMNSTAINDLHYESATWIILRKIGLVQFERIFKTHFFKAIIHDNLKIIMINVNLLL